MSILKWLFNLLRRLFGERDDASAPSTAPKPQVETATPKLEVKEVVNMEPNEVVKKEEGAQVVNNIDMGKITFIEFVQPQLESGTYSLTTKQRVKGTEETLPETTYNNPKKFYVNGQRFALNPEDVISTFPPSFSLGEFSNVIPHVVLSRPTLPWERGTGDSSGASWLGLLVFNEAEDNPLPENTQIDLLHLLSSTQHTQDGVTGELPTDTFFPDFPTSDEGYAELDYGESWLETCMTIDISVDDFTALAPTTNDLVWLAHARAVETQNKSEAYFMRLNTSAEDPSAPVQLAQVVSNRFPEAGKKTSVHLVSFERYGSYLPEGENHGDLQNFDKVRLVSLLNWGFTSVSEESTFTGLLLNVNNPTGENYNDTLSVTYTGGTSTPAEQAVANALEMGFSAFNHQTRMGDHTVSWYRGPFMPYKPTLSSAEEPIANTADALTRYNPDAGMFDVSYASAWQIGRLLALQNKHFSTALYNWKRGLTQANILAIENEFIDLSWEKIAELAAETLNNYANPLASSKAVAEPKSAMRVKREDRGAILRKQLTDHKKLRQLAEDSGSDEIPNVIANWLARLKLLYGVPFNYLVPDTRMLPLESMRFFYMDNIWLDDLLEGALSIGRSTTVDEAFDTAMSPYIRQHTNKELKKIRSRKMGIKTLAQDEVGDLATGFLMRSQVVSGWPGLEVIGQDTDGNVLDILRMDHLGPDVLLCMFDGEVQDVYVQQHAESLHFGVSIDPDDPSPEDFNKTLRYIDADGEEHPAGSEIPTEIAAPIPIKNYVRSEETEVLKINDLAQAIQSELATSVNYTGQFTSAEFALEMIEGVQRVTYNF